MPKNDKYGQGYPRPPSVPPSNPLPTARLSRARSRVARRCALGLSLVNGGCSSLMRSFACRSALRPLPSLALAASLRVCCLAWCAHHLPWCALPRLVLVASLGAHRLAWCLSPRMVLGASLGSLSRLVLIIAPPGAHHPAWSSSPCSVLVALPCARRLARCASPCFVLIACGSSPRLPWFLPPRLVRVTQLGAHRLAWLFASPRLVLAASLGERCFA